MVTRFPARFPSSWEEDEREPDACGCRTDLDIPGERCDVVYGIFEEFWQFYQGSSNNYF
jgi:hypothetical protein